MSQPTTPSRDHPTRRDAEPARSASDDPAYRTRPGLVVFDADSTLTATEGIDLLAEIAGVGAAVSEITARAMAGELDFAASLRERVALLAGQPAAILAEAGARTVLTPGSSETCQVLRDAGWRLGVVSGGFAEMVAPLAAQLAIHHVRANRLEVAGGRLTGRVEGRIVDRAAKAEALRRWARADGVALPDTVAVGDGANDIDMLDAAGFAVGFQPKDALRAHCDAVIDHGGLEALVSILKRRGALG